MNDGLINIRGLAKYLIKEEKIDATLDAVVSAIRRYNLDAHGKIFSNAQKSIQKITAISTRSPLANISVAKDAEVQNALPKLFSIIHYNLGDVLRIIQGDESIKIIVDEKNIKKVRELFSEKNILGIEKNLGEICVHMHPDGKLIPGIFAYSANELAINGINILETMSCFPEWLWFVNENDLHDAYNVLYNLWKQSSIKR